MTAQPTAGPSEPPPPKRPRKEKRPPKQNIPDAEQPRSNPYVSPSVSNRPTTINGRASPLYAPGSPLAQAASSAWTQANGHPEANGHYDHADGYDQPNGVSGTSPSSSQPTANPQVNFGVRSTGDVSADDALGFAMTAQFWAGYWMGVASTKTALPMPSEVLPGREVGPTNIGEPEQTRRASNVIVTRQQFYRPPADGLRR